MQTSGSGIRRAAPTVLVGLLLAAVVATLLADYAKAGAGLSASRLALAAGAMLFVVNHEVIPETHHQGHQLPATLGLMGGFAVMMVLDNALR